MTLLQFKVDPTSIDKVSEVINMKIAQGEYLASPTAMTEIAKAVFTITAKKFLVDLSIAANADPKTYQHLYEWGQIGNPAQKLFIMKRTRVQYGNLKIVFLPLKSHKPVPIDPVLQQPGTNGQSVTAQVIFRDRMEIVEEGRSVRYVTSRNIAFSPDGDKIVFVPRGKVISILHPGGDKGQHALLKFSESWYTARAPEVVESSRLIKQIGNRVAAVMNANNSSVAQVAAEIKMVTSQYSKELSEI